MTLDLQRVAAAMGASGEVLPAKVAGWSVDTRTLAVGDLFFALRGPNFDGQSFVPAAREKGALAVVVERPTGVPAELVVGDALRALQDLARWARRDWGGRLIGV
ncbi:MAG TPA: Mur ligase domain-containing protein, partial [Bryobacteraceae bacterium]|nr:Mur ligase domain-containing protein [Bryobacteraceae bacterium]